MGYFFFSCDKNSCSIYLLAYLNVWHQLTLFHISSNASLNWCISLQINVSLTENCLYVYLCFSTGLLNHCTPFLNWYLQMPILKRNQLFYDLRYFLPIYMKDFLKMNRTICDAWNIHGLRYGELRSCSYIKIIYIGRSIIFFIWQRFGDEDWNI